MASTTFSGPVTSTNGFVGELTGAVTIPTYTVSTAPSTATAGQIIYVSNGLGGNPCIAVGNGTNWISPAGTAISAT